MEFVNSIIDWVSIYIPAWVFIALVVHGAVLGTVAYMILLERKVASWVQDRIGPNRVGLGFGLIPGLKDKHMFGLGQPLADGLKFIVKEDYRPKGVDKILFTMAPVIMIVVIIISIVTIPWGGIKQSVAVIPARWQAADVVPWGATLMSSTFRTATYQYNFQIGNLNIGVLYILATLSLAVYGVVIGGWASNNKYSFLGGLRATANMISYEIPLGLCVLCIVLMYGTLDLATIVDKQAHLWIGFIPAWNIFTQPLAFILFLICIHAEANRAPFDLAEAEQELVGGYHTEYSSMRFALFFLAEYAGMITTSCLLVALFWGGWHLPGLNGPDPTHPSVTDSLLLCIIRGVVFFTKAMVVMFIFMWTRWSLPRFRFDQLMQIAWRGLIPITLAMLAMTIVLVYYTGGVTLDGVDFQTGMIFFVVNIVLLAIIMIVGKFLPAAPNTNRKISIPGSRFNKPNRPAISGAAV